MKYLSFADRNRRIKFQSVEIEYSRLKAMYKNQQLPINVRNLYAQKFPELGKGISFTKIKNRCLFTGKAQSVYKIFKLNRITLREIFGRNLMTGLKKSSW